MLSFETALRLAVVGQEILIAIVFLFGRGSLMARVSGSLLLLSVSAYLLESDSVLRDGLAVLSPVLMLLALIVPHCLWLFARAVFEAPWPSRWVIGAFALLALAVWSVYLDEAGYGRPLFDVANVAVRVGSLWIVGHALLIAAKGRPDDLIERRRRYRVYFIVIIAAQIAAVLALELVLGTSAPAWLTLLNVIVIAALTIGLAVPLLRLDPEFFAPMPADDAAERAETLKPAEAVLKQALLSEMRDGAYRQPGLTIRNLAEQLGYPEHQLRKLINGRLGYRNFSAFLNSYRIPEAQTILADAKRVRTPVLTIALDLGYGSLGPFNRAFKSATNMTPTEYRQQALQSNRAESE